MHFDAREWSHWWVVHLRWFLSDARLLFRRTAEEFLDDHCSQLSAGIAYYVLFSIFPLAILVVSISGLVLTDDSIRQDVVDEIFQALPLSESEGRGDLESAVDGIATGLSAIGLVSILGLLWSASAMMGSIRYALDEAWDTSYRRRFLRGKLIDLGLLLGVGVLISASISTTVVLQVARNISDDFSETLGPIGSGTSAGFEVVAIFVPLLLSFLTFAVIYKYVPSVRTHFRHVWPGALLAGVLFEFLKNGFATYLRFFGNYDAVYGSLGAVIIFLFFVYLSAVALLIGAEMASEWPRVIHGHYDAELASHGLGPRAPWYRRLLAAFSGLVSDAGPAPAHVDDDSARSDRLGRKEAEVRQRRAAAAPASDDAIVPEPQTPAAPLRPPSLADDPGGGDEGPTDDRSTGD